MKMPKVKRLMLGVILASMVLSSIGEGQLNLVLKAKAANNEWRFEYTGETQSWTAPQTGKYYIEVVGAGSEPAGYGGKLTGYANITGNTTYFITVGGAGGRNKPAGYNGGGTAYFGAGSGGGATSITTGTDRGVLANYVNYRDEVIAVAGGAGGVPSCFPNNSLGEQDSYDQWQRPDKNQSDGSGSGAATVVESGRFYRYHQSNDRALGGSRTSGYGFGQGESAIKDTTNSSGAGGGGYFGGKAPTSFITLGGAGGGGYYRDLYDITSTISDSTGNGYVIIKYVGPVELTVNVDPGTGGIFNGSSEPVTFKVNSGDIVDLSDLQPKSGYTFEGWKRIENGRETNYNDVSVTVGFSSINFVAQYKAPLNFYINQSDADNSLTMLLEQDDTYDKLYRIYQSYDNSNWNLAESNNNDIGYKEEVHTFAFSQGVRQFTLTTDKQWTLYAYGGEGGERGGYGGLSTGSILPSSEQIIYFVTGGKGGDRITVSSTVWHGGGGKGGYNGGGNGGAFNTLGSSGGGGATHIATTNRGLLTNYKTHIDELLLVAGGGGAEYREATGGGTRGGDSPYGGLGGTQNSGGGTASSPFGESYNDSGFGYGATAWYGNGGGGGGLYGGGAAIGTVNSGGGGGSGYVNTSKLKNTNTSNGVNYGNGYVKIIGKEQSITKNLLHNIKFEDTKAPNIPSNGIDEVKDGKKYASWDNNGDNGVTIYHYAESIDRTTGKLLNKTDVKSNYVESGVNGWYYYIDERPTGVVTKQNQFTSVPEVNIEGQTKITYMHVACVDRAGNLSGTYSFKITPSYVIKYDPNGGTGNTVYDQADYGVDYIIKSNTFSKTGYTFMGWGLDNKTVVTHQPSETIKLDTAEENKVATLYAIWKPITYTVNVYQNAPKDYIGHGHNINVPSSVPSKTKNQSFDNSYGSDWTYVETDGESHWTKTFVYDATVLNDTTDFYSITGWHTDNGYMWSYGGTNGEVSGISYPSDQTNRWNLTTIDKATINLYPKWEKNTYFIDYKGNDTVYNIYGDKATTKFSGIVETTTCKYDTDVTLATNKFTKPGYTFKEWNTKSDGKGTSYKSGEYLVKPDLTATNNGRVTLYAIWEPNTYNIVFNPLDSTIMDWDSNYPEYYIPVRFDSVMSVNVPWADKIGFEFGRWSKDKQPSLLIKGSYGEQDITRFFTKGTQNISVSNSWETKKEEKATIHFNPFTETLEVFPWFNRKPIFVDVYEGLFFEGQVITYNDLLELVRAWDYEDNYLEMQNNNIKEFFENKINKVDQSITDDNTQIEYLIEEKDKYIYEERPDDDPKIEEINTQLDKLRDHLHALFEEKEYIEQEQEKILESLPNRAQLLDLAIAEIDYTNDRKFDYRNDTDIASNGISRVYGFNPLDNTYDKTEYNNKYLKTGSSFLGDFSVIYQVSDSGIPYTDMSGNESIIPNTDVTMEYKRVCHIQFNWNPLLATQGIMLYTSDNIGDSAQYLKKCQAVFDSEDTEDNIPWWSKEQAQQTETGKVLHDENQYTLDRLQDNIVITGVKNFTFAAAFEYEHPEVVEAFRNKYTSPEGYDLYKYNSIGYYHKKGVGNIPVVDKKQLVNEIYSLRTSNSEFANGVTGSEVYRALTGMNITFDSVDQWGKWTSNNVSSPQYERTDNEDDSPGKVDTDTKPDGFTSENNGGLDTPDDLTDEQLKDIVSETEEQRTVTMVIINEDDTNSIFIDSSLYTHLIKDNIRYINNDYINTLGLSYWGTYGKQTIEEVLNKNNKDTVRSQHSGSYKAVINKSINVIIRDYAN